MCVLPSVLFSEDGCQGWNSGYHKAEICSRRLPRLKEENGQSTIGTCYEKFLILWKDADPGIAEVEDAKERLAGLKR